MTQVEAFLSLASVVLTIVNTWVLLAIRSYREDIEKLRKADHELRNSLQTLVLSMTEKMSSIQLLVAGNYVTKEEFRLGVKELVHKMDTLSHQLSTTIK